MAESKHAPAPWSVASINMYRRTFQASVAAACSPNPETVEATACLIEAAPCLLAALREVDWLANRQLRTKPLDDLELDRASKALDLARAAIGKAEGQL